MFSTTPRTVICFLCSLLMLLVVVMPGLTPVNVPGSIASADPTIPRSYVEFIEGAYVGALGRLPSCFEAQAEDRKSTRLNSSHSQISYAVFCLKKKKKK